MHGDQTKPRTALRGFRHYGDCMPPTLAEVDEALFHASLVPEDERGVAWQKFVDALLEQRDKAEGIPA